jgi:hypothetical protein
MFGSLSHNRFSASDFVRFCSGRKNLETYGVGHWPLDGSIPRRVCREFHAPTRVSRKAGTMLSQVTREFCAPYLSQRACFDSKYDFASHFAHFRDVLLAVDSDNLPRGLSKGRRFRHG